MSIDEERWRAAVAAVALLLLGVDSAVAVECSGDALLDPATMLACMYLPPGAYRPVIPGTTPVTRTVSSLCNDTACPSPQCFYCSYCQMAMRAVCACSSPPATGAPLTGPQPYAIRNFTVPFAIENFTVPASRTLGQCTFADVCPAELNYTGANCSSGPPVSLVAINPTVGPLSGGTLLVLNGTGMRAVTGVHVGTTPCDVASFRSWQTDSVVYCLLAGGQNAGAALNVSYTVAGGGAPVVSQLLFTYSADPVVLGLSPLEAIVSQSRLVVTGQNLAEAGRAFLVSTLVGAAAKPITTYYAPCSAASSGTLLSCGCPTSGIDGNDTAVYDMYVYVDGFRNTSLASGANDTWSIPFAIFPDPIVNTFPSAGLMYVFDPAYGAENSGPNITLTGSGLDVVDASRYTIEIGVGTWCQVLSVDNATLICTPSSFAAPGLGDNYTTYLGQSAPSMTVLINDTDYAQFVGYVMFYNHRTAYIIIGVTFGALVLTAIVLAIALVLYGIRRRSIKKRRADAHLTKESLGAGAHSRK